MADVTSIAIATGVGVDLIKKEIAVCNILPRLFMILTNENQKCALYGGTAINKAYFGEKQRFSFDIDVECEDYKKCKEILSKQLKPNILTKKRSFFFAEYEGVQVNVDIAEKISSEEPKLREIHSLLEFYGFPIPPIIVPSYSLEYLVASKITTFFARQTTKDAFDIFMASKHELDNKKVKMYLEELSKKLWGITFQELMDRLPTKIDETGMDVIPVNYRIDVGLLLDDVQYFIRSLAG